MLARDVDLHDFAYAAGRMPVRERTRTMLKRDELSNPTSCLSRARDDELIFVLLGRDPAAATAIRFWVRERIRIGKNTAADPQIICAEELACRMDQAQGKSAPPPLLHICRFCHKPLLAENAAVQDGCPCNLPLGINDGIPCAQCGQPRRNGECPCRHEPSAATLARECSAAVAARISPK